MDRPQKGYGNSNASDVQGEQVGVEQANLPSPTANIIQHIQLQIAVLGLGMHQYSRASGIEWDYRFNCNVEYENA